MESNTAANNLSTPDYNGTHTSYDYELEWIITQSLSVPLGLFALYLTISQTVYCVMEKQKSKGRARGTKHSFPLNLMLAFSSTCAFLRSGFDFRHTLGKFNDLGCDVAIKFKLVAYILALVTLYMLLWLRQRVFYTHQAMKFLNTTVTKVLAWTIAVFMVSGVGSASIIFLVVGKYLGTPLGCVIKKTPLDKIRWIIMIGFSVSSQLLLLSLFIYPLIKHKMRSDIGKPKNKKYDSVISLIRRATATTGVCVASDMAFALIILKLGHKIVTMSTFVYDLNIVINVVAVICSFPNWRDRLLPCKRRSEDRQESESATFSARLSSDV